MPLRWRTAKQHPPPPPPAPATLPPLLKLPPELLLQIFDIFPDLWSTISLRLTCRQLNAICIENETYMRRRRQAIIAPVTQWYKHLTTLHVPPEWLHTTDGEWTIEPRACQPSVRRKLLRKIVTPTPRSPFTIDIMKRLPYINRQYGEVITICAISFPYDWRLYYPFRNQKIPTHHESRLIPYGVNPRYCIPLSTGRCGFILDTMHTKVYVMFGEDLHYGKEGTPYSWPLEDFVHKQCSHVKDLAMLYLHLSSGIMLDRLEAHAFSTDNARQMCDICASYGWPDNFRQEGIEVLMACLRANSQWYQAVERVHDQEAEIEAYLLNCDTVKRLERIAE